MEASDTMIPDEFLPYINEISLEYHICPELVQAIIERESRGQADAANGYCKGLMQINESYHVERMERLGVSDIYNPYDNIRIGCDLISELFGKYGDVGTVLMVYHGELNAVSNGEAGNYSNYSKSVMERSTQLERLHGK